MKRADDLFGDVPLRVQLIGWSILMGAFIILGLLGLLFLRPAPMPRTAVLGCYQNKGSPWLRIDEEKIFVGDDTGRSLRFAVEPAKEGYQLAVRPAMNLHRAPDGTYYFKDERGVGYFWPLLTVSSDRAGAMSNPSQYGGRFSIIANDGVQRTYVRASSVAACQ